jgi:[ribosomal protein S5]-alanine N-acetyltransferase
MSLFDPFPVLSTPRLRLRCLSLADSERMFQALTHPTTAKFSGKAPPSSVDDIRAKIEMILEKLRAGDAVSWALESVDTGDYLGSAGLWRWDKAHFRAEIGYEITSSAWGKGLMTEALAPILAYGFDQMKLHSVEAKVHPENAASMRVLTKLGFEREAYLRENHFNPNTGVFEDTAVYSLLAPR